MSPTPAPGESFVTILRTADDIHKWLVVIMKPQGPTINDNYVATRTSQRLSRPAAEALAGAWAAAKAIKVVL